MTDALDPSFADELMQYFLAEGDSAEINKRRAEAEARRNKMRAAHG